MHSAVVMLASAALLFSGASGQLQDCDPAETPAEPPCPYGHWCPGSGVCPPNPCLDFPCVHGRCELTKPDSGPQGTQRPAPHTPMCVCDEHFHCANNDCFVANSCVPDIRQPTCCEITECPVCWDGSQGECVENDRDDTDCTCHCPTQPTCHGVTCPAHSHLNSDATAKDECCVCDHNWCGPAGSTWMPGHNEGFCATHSTCCDVSCSQHGHCEENPNPAGTGTCVCDWVIPPADPAHPRGMHPAWLGPECQFLDPCREKNCGSHGRCETPPTAISPPNAPICEDCIETQCKCDNKCWSGDSCQNPADDLPTCLCEVQGEADCGEHGTLQAQFDANGNVQCSCVCSDCFSGDRCEIPWDLDNKCKECVDNVVRPTSAAESCGENCGTCNAATGHCDCMPDFFGEFCSEYDACTGYNCGSHRRCNAFVLPPAVQSACPAILGKVLDKVKSVAADKCDDYICDSAVWFPPPLDWISGAVCATDQFVKENRFFHGKDLCSYVVDRVAAKAGVSAPDICADILGDTCHPNVDLSCDCDYGFSGPFCERDLCFGKVCGSHGVCQHTADYPGTCECDEGWTGEHCQTPPPPTYVDPCQPSDANPDGWTCNGHGRCGADPDDSSSPVCDCDAGWCGDHCDILEWGAAASGGVFSNPGATSAGQRVAVGAVGMAAAAAIIKRRMDLAAAPAGETIYAPQVDGV